MPRWPTAAYLSGRSCLVSGSRNCEQGGIMNRLSFLKNFGSRVSRVPFRRVLLCCAEVSLVAAVTSCLELVLTKTPRKDHNGRSGVLSLARCLPIRHNAAWRALAGQVATELYQSPIVPQNDRANPCRICHARRKFSIGNHVAPRLSDPHIANLLGCTLGPLRPLPASRP